MLLRLFWEEMKTEAKLIFNLSGVAFYSTCVCATLLHSCLTLYNPMDHSPPGFFVHGVFQARILEWVAISSSSIPTQELNPCLRHLLHLPAEPSGKPLKLGSIFYLSHLVPFWFFSSVHGILQATILE